MYRKVLSFLFCFFLNLNLFAFPLCIYGVNSKEDIKAVKKAGFNCFHTYKKDFGTLTTLAALAKKEGLKAVFYPNQIISKKEIKQANTWPMLAWYLYDEPDVHKIAIEDMIRLNNKIKHILPNAPTALVIGQGKTKLDYYNIADILMVDWYPVPHLALKSFGQELALARAKLEPKTNFWGVVQAFNWKDYKQYRPDNDRIGRFPTEEEIYFMSWQGIANGANGIFYFAFNTGGKKLNKYSPEVWQALKKIIKDIKKFSYFMEKGQEFATPFTLPKELENRTWFYKNKYYTLIVNASKDSFIPNLPNKAKIILGKKELSPYKVLIIRYK
jgi:hypothetical protein